MKSGIRGSGHEVVARRQNEGYAGYDVAVMWGWSKKRVPAPQQGPIECVGDVLDG